MLLGDTVLPDEPILDETTLREEFYRGTGKGGQHRNKVSTAVRVVHTPTGITVATERGRSQAHNRKKVRARLAQQLAEQATAENHAAQQTNRRAQLTDPTHTITHNEQRGTVSSTHGWSVPARKFANGRWDEEQTNKQEHAQTR